MPEEGETYSIQLPNIPRPRKMSTQTRLTSSCRNTAESTQHARRTHYHPPQHHPDRNCRRQTIQHHGHVVEDIRGKAESLALWLQSGAEPVCEENRSQPRRGLLRDLQQERGGRGGGGVAYADTYMFPPISLYHECT